MSICSQDVKMGSVLDFARLERLDLRRSELAVLHVALNFEIREGEMRKRMATVCNGSFAARHNR